MTPTSHLLAQALQEHQRGNLTQAEQLYRQVLHAEPNHPEALHYLGMLYVQAGRSDLGLDPMRRAAALCPTNSLYHSNLGVALGMVGLLDEATLCARRSLELEPGSADAHYRLGNALRAQRQFNEAEGCFRRTVRLRPDHADAHNNLGEVLRELGRLDEALASIQEGLRLRPAFAEGLCSLANVLVSRGRTDEAVAHYQQALRLKPNYAEVYSNLAFVLGLQGKLTEAVACGREAVRLRPTDVAAWLRLGALLGTQENWPEAVACFRTAMRLVPNLPEAHTDLAGALRKQGNLEEAERCVREAVRLRPDFARAHNELGLILSERGRPDEGIPHLHEALRLQPVYSDAYNNLGCAHASRERYTEAEDAFRRALELEPGFANACYNLGNALSDQGKFAEALACFARALRLKTHFPEAHFNRALLLLLVGNFAEGWPEYEWRWYQPGADRRPLPKPEWDGSSLEGKTILLRAEQGLGDAIQFIRYAPLLRQRGATVIVECHEPLASLLGTCPGVDRALPRGAPLPDFDVHAPLLSLPRLFGTTADNILATVPYLFPDESKVEHRRRELQAVSEFKVGIAWRGNPKHHRDRFRSIPLEEFAVLARVPGVRLYSLQRGEGSEQIERIRDRFSVTDPSAGKSEGEWTFQDAAALVKNLDLVVSCDSALVHLAGALAVPVWVALPLIPDWRWLLDREDSPWYPTLRLFRKTRLYEWTDVFARMAEALAKLTQR
jgi:tetratricopeptide (TPR) repeat protein